MGTKQYDSATDLITLTRSSSATFLGSNGLIQTVTNNAPRIEYNAAGTVKGLLIEEARTNLVTNSNDLTNAEWGSVASSNSTNAGVSPDGTSNANKVVPNVSSSRHYTYVTKDLHLTGSSHTFSVYVAAAGYGFATVCAGTNSGSAYYAVVIDLSDGTKTATYAGGTQADKTCTVEAAGSYYRVSISGNGEKYYVVGGVDTGTYTPSLYGYKNFSGDGTSGILVYGAQIEDGSFPTSYIPTSGATATRARDLASILVTDFGYNKDAGSLVLDVETPLTDQLMIVLYFNTVAHLNSRGFVKEDGSGSSGNMFTFGAFDGGGTSLQLPNVGVVSETTKLGLSYKDNEVAVRDGGTVTSGTGRSNSPTQLYLGGRNFSGGYQSQCWIKSVKYYPRKLTDAQLQELTT